MKHYPVVNNDNAAPDAEDEGEPEDEGEQEEGESEYIDTDLDELEEGEVIFEDREYQEDEVQYIQAYHSAYADVRAKLRDQRKQRGFTRTRGRSNSSPSSRPRSQERGGKGRGKGRKGEGSRFNKQRAGPFSKSGSSAMVKGTNEDLLARTRCYNCQELGHVARDCPLKGGGKGAKKTFIVCRGNSSTITSAFLLYKGVPEEALQRAASVAFPTSSGSSVEQYSRIFAGVKVRGFEALVDTAAEDGVIGDKALKQMTEELKKFHLQPVDVKTQGALPCAGIGGAATIVKTVDLPTSVAGQQGVLRMTVLKDSETFSTPPLLPISYLEAVKAIIDLSTEELRLPDGFKTPMYRLSSGHRAVDILQFQEQPWLLPDEFWVDGKDPFRLPESSLMGPLQLLCGR